MSNLSDAELVRLSLLGDKDAFGELIRRHQGTVMAVCTWRDADMCDIEDAAQETFLRAFRGLSGLKDPSRVGAWLVGIAQHVARDRARAASRNREIGAGNETLDGREGRHGRPDLSPEENEELAMVLRVLAELDESHRAVVAMRYFEGLSSREIAERLGEPRSTVRSRLHYAFQRLRSALAVRRAGP
ncbi:MAG: sigma-70 family RNA polymerase sigma factor [Planctomycetota bacterium]|nr:sigma-70 family RNA polymerase sigma factor [Planctomycetota bacterium]